MHRTYYASKAAWAAPRAAECRSAADDLCTTRVPGNGWRRGRAREGSAARLRAEARRFERLAEQLGNAPAPSAGLSPESRVRSEDGTLSLRDRQA